MMSPLFSLLCLIGPAHALVATKLGDDSKLTMCSDPKFDALLAPGVEEMKKFFEGKGMTMYPTALSAIGSLRYGGNTALVDGSRHIADHDVDFLVVGGPESNFNMSWSSETIYKLMIEIREHMRDKGFQLSEKHTFGDGIEGYAMTQRYLKKGLKDADGNTYDVMNIRLKMPDNEMMQKFEESQLHRSWEHIKEIFSSSFVEKGSSEPAAEEEEQKSAIHFDFYFKNGPQAQLQPHPTKKMRFHGTTMRYPADTHSTLDSFLQVAFWDKQSDAAVIAAKQGMCGFAAPEGHIEDDMPNTPENAEVALKCSAALQANGYESFKSLCDQEVPPYQWLP